MNCDCECHNPASSEMRCHCNCNRQLNQFGMGALSPPGMEWQEGKTAGEIGSINLLLRLKDRLPDLGDQASADEIHRHLVWLGVIT